jgi:hypothetical protein
MSRLDDYRSALLAADPDQPVEKLLAILDDGGGKFASFIIDHGIAPLWHLQTGRPEFRESRLAAEAEFLVQEHTLRRVDEVFEAAGIEYAVIKGAANRLLLYENPAIRACHDVDLLVSPQDKVRAAQVLLAGGFEACRIPRSISRALVLSNRDTDIDLHWGILREGRERLGQTARLLERRRRIHDVWMLGAEGALYVLLVHPVFAKHLAGHGMGLHRVLDVTHWLESQAFDWEAVVEMLQSQGLCTAAWATLRWVELLAGTKSPDELAEMSRNLAPGAWRAAWLTRWLKGDLSQRTAGARWPRLIGFSTFVHDTPVDSVRALTGRYRAHRRRHKDLADFAELLS